MVANLMNKTLRLLDRIGRLDVWVSALTMFSIVSISIWGVITRYFLGDPAGWVGELSMALFVWLTFFGTSILARRGEIVNIEFLLRFFPASLSFFVKKIFSTLLLVGCLAVIIYLGFQLSLFSHDRYTSILRIPYTYIYLGIPLGSLFTLYHVLRHAVVGPQYLEQLDPLL
jgi:TRAP-type C4-dicarboxylate transport system permease small subunit